MLACMLFLVLAKGLITLKIMNKDKAKRVLAHLESTGQGFCFVNGAVISRMDAELIASGGEHE